VEKWNVVGCSSIFDVIMFVNKAEPDRKQSFLLRYQVWYWQVLMSFT